jgi:hypothetical protein
VSHSENANLCRVRTSTTAGGLEMVNSRRLVRETHIDATSGIRRRLPKPHCQSMPTCATNLTLLFVEIPEMATPHERRVVQNLRLQLVHARYDGGRHL